MPKEVNVQITCKIPDGYEFVRYGNPTRGELYVQSNLVVTESFGDLLVFSYPIVRKIEPFKLPSWVKSGVWYCMNSNGEEWLIDAKQPLIWCGDNWMQTKEDADASWNLVSDLNEIHSEKIVSFTGDAKDSLYRQP